MSDLPPSLDDPTLAFGGEGALRVQRQFLITVQKGLEQGATLLLDAADVGQPQRVMVGTSPVCGLRLSDRTVSRRHLAFELDALRLRVVDLGSRNGSFVNGVRFGEVFISGGETLSLGETVLSVSAESAHYATPSVQRCFGRVIGESPAMRRLYPSLERLANGELTLLIEGETGTGKELLCEALHEQGARASKPFVVFDCAGIAVDSAESTLFGSERAAQARTSIFDEADGGTLLFDEVAELDLGLQSKLLRVLERNEYRAVGGSQAKRANVRFLFATSRDLDQEVQAGRFREDLFFRIAVVRLELPPLRRRSGDVAVLADAFWRMMGGPARLDAGYLHALESYPWPGNVRELRNAVARRLALGDSSSDQAEPSGSTPKQASGVTEARSGPRDWLDTVLDQKLPLPKARQQVLDVFLRRYVERVLAEHDGNVSHAAAASGLARRYFQILKARQR